MPVPHRIVIFDGQCNLCNAWVQFVIDRDRRGLFKFASNASATGKTLLIKHGIDPQGVGTVVLIDGENVYTHSAAVLRIVRRLRWPWPVLAAAAVVPRAVRDWIYNWVAGNRYRWFGKQETCRMPTPELAQRFLT